MSTPHPIPRRRSPALLLGLLLLSGCSGHITRDAQTGDAIQDAFEIKEGTGQPAPPEEVSQALLPPVQLQLPGLDPRADVEQRFDVKVRRVRARDFFLSLVEGTPYSMVIDPLVGGYISLDMKNVSVPEVMEVVRSVHGYDYKRRGRIIQVFPNTMHTRIFQIDYLAVKRAGESLTTAKSGQITLSGNDNGGNGDSANSSAITTTNNIMRTSGSSSRSPSRRSSTRMRDGRSPSTRKPACSWSAPCPRSCAWWRSTSRPARAFSSAR
jgi:MSHA biogenesis protein MshL